MLGCPHLEYHYWKKNITSELLKVYEIGKFDIQSWTASREREETKEGKVHKGQRERGCKKGRWEMHKPVLQSIAAWFSSVCVPHMEAHVQNISFLK